MLKDFILPGGSRAAAYAHLVRTVCRRAERAVLVLAASETVSPCPRLPQSPQRPGFRAGAHTLNRAAGQPDVLWRKGSPRQCNSSLRRLKALTSLTPAAAIRSSHQYAAPTNLAPYRRHQHRKVPMHNPLLCPERPYGLPPLRRRAS